MIGTEGMYLSEKESYNIPEGYFYTKDHEWIKSKGSSFLIGITDYAAKMLHDIVYVTLPDVGSSLGKKEVFGQVESVKTVSDMYMPISGRVEKRNEKLAQAPELVAESPYSDGWMLEITSDSYSSEASELLDAKSYSAFISQLDATQ